MSPERPIVGSYRSFHPDEGYLFDKLSVRQPRRRFGNPPPEYLADNERSVKGYALTKAHTRSERDIGRTTDDLRHPSAPASPRPRTFPRIFWARFSMRKKRSVRLPLFICDDREERSFAETYGSCGPWLRGGARAGRGRSDLLRYPSWTCAHRLVHNTQCAGDGMLPKKARPRRYLESGQVQ